MIIKLYIQKHVFHLPRNQDDLTKSIQETFYKRKSLVKSAFAKMYRVSDIESQSIQFEKDVNVFLVNLYLQVMEHKEKFNEETDIPIILSDENIMNELSKELDQSLESTSFDELENIVENFLKGDTTVDHENTENKTEKQTEVEFNIDWVKKMDRKIRE